MFQPIARRTSASGSQRITFVRRRSRRRSSARTSQPSGKKRDSGDETTTSDSASPTASAARSACAVEAIPPSTNRVAPTRTGLRIAGTADEQRTAVPTSTSGAPSRPKTTRAPVSTSTAVIQSGRAGQRTPSNRREIPVACDSADSVPSGRSAATSRPGRARHGAPSTRRTYASDAGRERRVSSSGDGEGDGDSDGDGDGETRRASSASGSTPARRSAPAWAPADVPMITSAAPRCAPVAARIAPRTPA
jgi:hypothetical protein